MGAHIRIVLLTVPRDDAELAADALWAAGAAAVEERAGPTPSTATLVSDVAPLVPGAGWTVVEDEVDDGVDAWREHATAWTAGPFVVRPPWLPPSSDGRGALDLVIDPGHAFGSGSHATTRLALGALTSVVHAGDAVLDLGCGSGVLAIAAARLGASRVDAVDIDPVAREVTATNAAANGVTVRVLPSTSVAGPADVDGPYDVVVANISAAALRDLSDPLAGVGATYVLTGMLDAQADDVAAAFAQAAACVEEARSSADGWSALVLRATP